MVATPSFPASEAMYFMPGIPFMARSKGITTDFIINSPFAPGYSAVIFTFGGEIDGNCVIGNFVSDNAPRNIIINDMTIDNTGL